MTQEQPAFKRDDRVEITGPDDKGNTQYLGLHGRVVTKTEGTGAFWLHSLEERWYIPGFYPASSLCLLPEVQTRPARPAYPTCSTCKHWAQNGENDTGGCLELNNPHGNHLAYLNLMSTHLPEMTTALLLSTPSQFEPSIVTRSAYGCLLHSDLTEAGA